MHPRTVEHTMNPHTAQLLTRVLAFRHPSLRRAALQAAPPDRPEVLTHAVRSWIFTGHSELLLPCD